jgi:hypothetical protein
VVSDLLCVIYNTLPFDRDFTDVAIELIEILAMHSNMQKPINWDFMSNLKIFLG